MGEYGIDVSNHQPNFDFAAAKRNGFTFAILKLSEGATFKDAYFRRHLTEARKHGLVVGSYHYQRTDSVSAQLANIKSMVNASENVPVIIDVEDGSGGVDITRSLVAELIRAGYRSPIVYIPKWYWSKIGSPSLAGLPQLWPSWYPDYVARPKEQGLAKIPPSAWQGYGGNTVAMLQFTSSPYDQNYYPGSLDQLRAMFTGQAPAAGGGTDKKEEDEDMTKAVTVYVKGDKAPNVYCIESSADGVRRRHVGEHEWVCLAAAGVKLGVVAQASLDALPKVAGSL